MHNANTTDNVATAPAPNADGRLGIPNGGNPLAHKATRNANAARIRLTLGEAAALRRLITETAAGYPTGPRGAIETVRDKIDRAAPDAKRLGDTLAGTSFGDFRFASEWPSE